MYYKSSDFDKLDLDCVMGYNEYCLKRYSFCFQYSLPIWREPDRVQRLRYVPNYDVT